MKRRNRKQGRQAPFLLSPSFSFSGLVREGVLLLFVFVVVLFCNLIQTRITWEEGLSVGSTRLVLPLDVSVGTFS